MPHFFFDIKNGHRLVDPAGLECRDEADAIAKATVIAAHIATETPAGQRKIAILDANRQEISAVPVLAPTANRAAE